MVRAGMTPELMQLIARGEYVVNEYAVAAAILGHCAQRLMSSSMLVASETVDDASVQANQLDSLSGESAA
jgi:hypothetical protein